MMMNLCFIADLSYGNQSKFQGRSTPSTYLQNQNAGYSYNLVGGASPYQPWSSYPLTPHQSYLFMWLFAKAAVC